ncbi:DUF2189 domain-containing protein [Arhodomonas aquaeolei]|uniref:DUF2189 domain-containing protein n=1 Tax=Arhodomonas aquaeolei TaxID=2369 RepID=UPI002167C916|nr:DUF2189 domain-containing protein [Arhodomonas aquaeolei]MCS4503529.1 DUF2189 domain-containing protein [Arhodomonas aquaeolei]
MDEHTDNDTGTTEDWIPEPRRLAATAPLTWVCLGWRDFRAAPFESLTFGLLVTLIGVIIAAGSWISGNLLILYVTAGGFLLVGPLIAFALYATSRALEQSQPPSVRICLRSMRANLSNHVIFALVLLVLFLLWARAAAMVHVFFPAMAEPGWRSWVPFLGIGSAVGAVFAALAFAGSAFSLPMMMDRGTDVISAVITSFRAVLSNRATMALWAALIVAGTVIGFATAFLGLAVTVPVLGYATWHGYRAMLPQQDHG